jgi:formylmethanofuran dehydrogenase subunit A
LKDIDREYSLYEIATLTRAAPAKILGLADRGHLGAGAAADIVLYEPDDDPEVMFAKPRYVFKDGEIVAERGEVKEVRFGNVHTVKPEYDPAIERKLAEYFARYQTMSLASFRIGGDELVELSRAPQVVTHPCRARR